MSNILIVDGHPDPSPERLNHAFAQAYAATAQEAGHDVRSLRISDLEIPQLRSADEFINGTPSDVIAGAQASFKWADHYVFFFPLWMSDMPALLKTFMEQTFRPGVAMDYGEGRRLPKQLLRGKSARIVVTMGMPAFFYRRFMGAYAVKALARMLQFAGVSPVRDTLIGGVGEVSDAKAQRWFARIAADARRDLTNHRSRGAAVARAVASAVAAATAGYAVYAIAGWARYGAVSEPEISDEPLDRVMPDYEVAVRHGIAVDAPADVAFDALCNLDFRHLPPFVGALFKTRGLFMRSADENGDAMPDGLIDQLARIGWTVMPESSAREVVLSTITQPWLGDPAFRSLSPSEFTRFSEPGYAKISITLRTQPIDEARCEVQSETRVKTTDPASRARFRRYWALVSPGVALIRIALLQHVKREAEALTRETQQPVPG